MEPAEFTAWCGVCYPWAFTSNWQIRTYIDERETLSASENEDTKDAVLPLLPAEEYIRIMQSTPTLIEMTRNPFVLRLFVETLPAMVAAGASLQYITRYSVYSAFVKQWFMRELARKSGVDQASLGVVNGDASAVVAVFELLCALLALEMLKANVLSVVLTTHSDDTFSLIWRDVKDAADEWLSADTETIASLQRKYESLSRREKSRYALACGCAMSLQKSQLSCPDYYRSMIVVCEKLSLRFCFCGGPCNAALVRWNAS